jgi:hypothetical protein
MIFRTRTEVMSDRAVRLAVKNCTVELAEVIP